MNRRTALRSLVATGSVPLAGFATGCVGDADDAAETTRTTDTVAPDESPAERIEWASMGLERVAFESLAEDDVRVTATVEIRNPTEYRVPVNGVQYSVLSGRDGEFAAFAEGEVRGCDFVELLGADQTFHDFVEKEGLPCPDEKTPTFVVEPNDTTEITVVSKPQTEAQWKVANDLVGANETVYVRVDGEAQLWNQQVDVHFETETGLKPP
ncbi:hypothetical protein NGM10_16245 (plasmid) [Halorussus salilacus]|uniref:hypothetical protein n=1 Tax=Halorussus salilacus TaxID=2953750 RepID=UPI00209D9854|nr:hypothetical protein [Halorussus salilacus]USZ69953.1 hypothetical protein NGM10_16245 [Halorussus salilacus]